MNAPRNRRHFLRTSTALIALPMLESFGFGRLAAAAPVPAPRPKSTRAVAVPKPGTIPASAGASPYDTPYFGAPLGAHVSTSGGVGTAPPRGIDIGATAIQLFTKQANQWKERLIDEGVTALGGRVPVNASGGLACFGEAVPAQAIQQVCELTWQLQGRAEGRQVEGARVGLSINQGLFGHGSCVIVTR